MLTGSVSRHRDLDYHTCENKAAAGDHKMDPSVLNIVILLGVLGLKVDAYPNGKVTESCSTMEPIHGATAQTISPPYNLVVSKDNYSNGEKLTVTLSGTSGSQMEGFLIQARAGSTNTPLGSFQTSDSNLQTLTCTTAAGAVSHTSNSKKSSVQMTWVAPSSNISDIQIRATVVQTKLIYWTNIVSTKLTYAGSTGSANTGSSGSQILVPAFEHLLLFSTLLICALLAL